MESRRPLDPAGLKVLESSIAKLLALGMSNASKVLLTGVAP